MMPVWMCGALEFYATNFFTEPLPLRPKNIRTPTSGMSFLHGLLSLITGLFTSTFDCSKLKSGGMFRFRHYFQLSHKFFLQHCAC